jgi:hypothetical protein
VRPVTWLAGVAIVLVQSNGALDAETLICSRWLDITTCQSPSGYTSHESTWNGITAGDDNRGDRWTSSRWQGIETTTVETPRAYRD